MKTEDIDKKIGMPDVDEEWAKFEREVLDKETKTGKRVFLGWTAGIAASIVLLAGIFLWGNDAEKQDGGGKELAKATNVEATEKMIVTDGDETKAVPANNSSNEDTASNNEREHTPDTRVARPSNNRKDNPSNNRKDDSSTPLLAHTPPQPTKDMDEQAPAVGEMTESPKVFAMVESQPFFRGGDRGLQEFIKQNLRYPSTAQAYGAKGRVIMQFMIDRGGDVSDVKAAKHLLQYDTLLLSRESEAKQTELKEQIAQQLEEECARVIAMMPRWTPGKIQGKVVSMKYNLPFLFKPSEFLANTSDTTALQKRIAGPEIVPNSSHLGKNAMRLIGRSTRQANDSALILVNGIAQPDHVVREILQGEIIQYFYQRQQLIDSIMIYKDEKAKQHYSEKYGDRAKNGVIDITTAPDTLCEAYVRQHPEVKQCRRYVTGYVFNEETNEPLSNANIYLSLWSDFGTMTDSTGHFAFWPPLTTDTLYASCIGYVTRKFHITGTKLIIRLSSATKIKDVRIKRRKE